MTDGTSTLTSSLSFAAAAARKKQQLVHWKQGRHQRRRQHQQRQSHAAPSDHIPLLARSSSSSVSSVQAPQDEETDLASAAVLLSKTRSGNTSHSTSKQSHRSQASSSSSHKSVATFTGLARSLSYAAPSFGTKRQHHDQEEEEEEENRVPAVLAVSNEPQHSHHHHSAPTQSVSSFSHHEDKEEPLHRYPVVVLPPTTRPAYSTRRRRSKENAAVALEVLCPHPVQHNKTKKNRNTRNQNSWNKKNKNQPVPHSHSLTTTTNQQQGRSVLEPNSSHDDDQNQEDENEQEESDAASSSSSWSLGSSISSVSSQQFPAAANHHRLNNNKHKNPSTTTTKNPTSQNDSGNTTLSRLLPQEPEQEEPQLLEPKIISSFEKNNNTLSRLLPQSKEEEEQQQQEEEEPRLLEPKILSSFEKNKNNKKYQSNHDLTSLERLHQQPQEETPFVGNVSKHRLVSPLQRLLPSLLSFEEDDDEEQEEPDETDKKDDSDDDKEKENQETTPPDQPFAVPQPANDKPHENNNNQDHDVQKAPVLRSILRNHTERLRRFTAAAASDVVHSSPPSANNTTHKDLPRTSSPNATTTRTNSHNSNNSRKDDTTACSATPQTTDTCFATPTNTNLLSPENGATDSTRTTTTTPTTPRWRRRRSIAWPMGRRRSTNTPILAGAAAETLGSPSSTHQDAPLTTTTTIVQGSNMANAVQLQIVSPEGEEVEGGGTEVMPLPNQSSQRPRLSTKKKFGLLHQRHRNRQLRERGKGGTIRSNSKPLLLKRNWSNPRNKSSGDQNHTNINSPHSQQQLKNTKGNDKNNKVIVVLHENDRPQSTKEEKDDEDEELHYPCKPSKQDAINCSLDSTQTGSSTSTGTNTTRSSTSRHEDDDEDDDDDEDSCIVHRRDYTHDYDADNSVAANHPSLDDDDNDDDEDDLLYTGEVCGRTKDPCRTLTSSCTPTVGDHPHSNKDHVYVTTQSLLEHHQQRRDRSQSQEPPNHDDTEEPWSPFRVHFLEHGVEILKRSMESTVGVSRRRSSGNGSSSSSDDSIGASSSHAPQDSEDGISILLDPHKEDAITIRAHRPTTTATTRSCVSPRRRKRSPSTKPKSPRRRHCAKYKTYQSNHQKRDYFWELQCQDDYSVLDTNNKNLRCSQTPRSLALLDDDHDDDDDAKEDCGGQVCDPNAEMNLCLWLPTTKTTPSDKLHPFHGNRKTPAPLRSKPAYSSAFLIEDETDTESGPHLAFIYDNHSFHFDGDSTSTNTLSHNDMLWTNTF